jgi:hypothetical protein
MKCVRCKTNSDYNQRQSGHCRKCGQEFALEPRSDEGVTDLMIQLAVTAVSDSGRLAWTDKQLYYDVCRRVRRRRIMQRLTRRRRVSVSIDAFPHMLWKWVSVYGDPTGRLARGAFDDEAPDATPPEIGDYGFDQLLVCDNDAIVVVLLANGFHADYKCPVLSYSGYPRRAFQTLAPLFRERPPRTLIVIHDADWDGCGLAARITEDPRWFAGVALPNVVDAGLRPADARRFRGLYQSQSSPPDETGAALTPEEQDWLRKYVLELEAVRPRGLIGVLAGVVRAGRDAAAEGGADGGGVWYADTWGDGDDDVG